MNHLVRGAPLALSIAIGVLLGTGGYTFYYAKGTSYFSNEPLACANCHIMQDQYDSWVKSSHHAIARCNDCHVPHTFPGKYINKMRNGWNHSKAFTLQNFEEPIRIKPKNLKTLRNNCIHCHQVFVSEILGHEGDRKDAVSCTPCHRSVGHMNL